MTVYIETPNGSGSGFFFNRNSGKDSGSLDYVVITNKHVVKDYSSVRVCWSVSQQCVVAKVTDQSENLDLAVIEHDSFSPNALLMYTAVPEFDSFGWGGEWNIGDVVYASGYPGGNVPRGRTTVSDPVVTEGIIVQKALSRYNSGLFIEHGADVASGSSGGPLMNNAGYIVGMNTGSNTEAERLEVAVPVGNFLNWIQTTEEPVTGSTSPQPTATPTPFIGKWLNTIDKTDPTTHEREVVVTLPSEYALYPSLGIICARGILKLAVLWGNNPVGSGQWITVSHRVDDEPAEESKWSLSPDGRATFLPDGKLTSTIRKLYNAGEFVVEVMPISQDPITSEFRPAGMYWAIKPALEACAWEIN